MMEEIDPRWRRGPKVSAENQFNKCIGNLPDAFGHVNAKAILSKIFLRKHSRWNGAEG